MKRIHRITSQLEFKSIFKSGSWIETPYFKWVTAKSEKPVKRLGLSTGRQVGNAVRRNRLKRVAREFFDANATSFPEGDTLILFANGAGMVPSKKIREELLLTLKRFR